MPPSNSSHTKMNKTVPEPSHVSRSCPAFCCLQYGETLGTRLTSAKRNTMNETSLNNGVYMCYNRQLDGHIYKINGNTQESEDIWQTTPVSSQLGLPVAPLVHMHHCLCEGVKFFLKPPGSICGLLLKSCCFFVVAIGNSLCSFCGSCFSLVTSCSLLLLQTKL